MNCMSRDQAYGGIILIVALLIAVFYIAIFIGEYVGLRFLIALKWWAIALPVAIFVLAVLAICMWIGWTMLTTPPPAPLEAEPTPPTSEAEAKPTKEK